MLFIVLKMLKKKLGLEAIEINWQRKMKNTDQISDFYKIPSTLTIPEGCEKIGMRAFRDCKVLERLKIPGSVKKIEVWSFLRCYGLKKVDIPEGVESIEVSAFSGCYNAEIILRKSRNDFKYIGQEAFGGVKDVKEEVGN